MKEIDELSHPEDVRYAQDHEWVRLEGETATIGISDYAQDQLGDIVFVELPSVGETLEKGQEFGTVESVKAVSELYMPISGEVTGVNGKLENGPDLVNAQPYGEGWMIRVKPGDPEELDALMSRDQYVKMLKEAE